MDDFERWPHQTLALEQIERSLSPGVGVCVTAPTGTGKTVIMADLLSRGRRAILYTNRRMLLEQTAARLQDHGIDFGIRAAGHDYDLCKPIQLASIQTDSSRVTRRKRWLLHDAEIVLVDEAHVQKEAQAVDILSQYKERGASIVGFTATPLDLGHIYDKLIVACTNSEARECGALVWADHYGPDEPDLRQIKRQKTGEYTYGDVVKVIMTHTIFGRVLEHYNLLNPEQKPTLLFAPGVKESLWFAEQFTQNGVPAAHIDGDEVWMDGQFCRSDQEARDNLKHAAKNGRVKVVCNRFVMREGIDWPFIEHMILATIFGAPTSYIQSGGRGLRAYPGKTYCTIQDHGGNWHRQGSLNSDRKWDMDISDYVISEAREERLRTKKEPEPISCPKCHFIRLSGPICPKCGFEHHTRSRMVVQSNGALRELTGDIYKPRRVDRNPGVEDRWASYFWRFRKTDKTFLQARAYYAYNHHWRWPPDNLPFMPVDPLDWFRSVKDVPFEKLHQPAKKLTTKQKALLL